MEVVLDRPRADEQSSADLRVGVAVTREQCDLPLLGCEVRGRLDGPLARVLSRRSQLAFGAVGTGSSAHGREHLVRSSEMLARLEPAALSTQPFPIEQVGAREVRRGSAPAEPLDCLPAALVRGLTFAYERACTGVEAEREIASTSLRLLGETLGRRAPARLLTAPGSRVV